ncbi:Formamidase [Termitomyces sp. T112]|nr:Formamidase [Termitomyces sp. T112]
MSSSCAPSTLNPLASSTLVFNVSNRREVKFVTMTAPTTSGTWTCLVHITSLGRLVWMERSLDVHYFENMPWGYTGNQEWKPGGLFAREFDSKATKVIWDLEGIYATSRHIRGVCFAGIPHPGIIGTAPSTELLEKWNEREGKLIEDHRDAISPVAYPLNPKGVYIGQATPEKVKEKIGLEGARTLPGRDNGGNRDIKNLSKGSRVYPPVFVFGANFSVGDLHFSQGDGEMTFCGAIEMAGVVTLITSINHGGIEKFGLMNPIFLA